MLKDTILVTIFIILSSVLGFIAQIVFASSFGASVEMDLYFSLLSFPSVITGIAPVIFSSVLIPTFAKFKSNKFELKKFINSIWIFILIFAALFTLFGIVFSIRNIDLFIPNTNPYLRNLAIQVSLMIWIGSGFIVMSGYLSAILNYNKHFIKVAWTSVLPAFFMIIIVLLFHKKLGVTSISLGFCIAFIIQFLIFLRASKISLNFKSFVLKHIPYKKLLLKQSFFVILSLLPFTVFPPIAYFWASKLEIGSVSYLGYSQSFASFLSVAVSMGISIVSFPELADKFANEKGESSLYKFENTLRYVLLIAMFAAGMLIVLRTPIITLFYERGSFNVESVINLTSVVSWYFLAAIFVAGLNLLRNLFYSKGEFKYIARIGLITPIIFFILAGFLKEKFSFVGIGIAYSISFAFLFFMTVYLAKKKEVNFLNNKFIYFILKNAISIIFTSLFISLIFPLIYNVTSQLISIVICMFLFSIIYFLFSKFIFKIKEIDKISSLLLSKYKSFSKS